MTNSSDAELRARLALEPCKVTQSASTERAFSGEDRDTKTPGVYRCVVCELDLFASNDKYDSRNRYPSFASETGDDRVSLYSDQESPS